MSSTGIPIEHICRVIINPETNRPLSPNTLKRHFREELGNGHVSMKAFALNKLYQLIAAGHASAVFFYLKCQHGWREREKDEPPPAGGTSSDPNELASKLREIAREMKRRTLGPAAGPVE